MTTGRGFYLYRNTGTYGSPTWVNVLDINATNETRGPSNVELGIRRTKFALNVYGSSVVSLNVTMLVDPNRPASVADANAFKNAALNGTTVDAVEMNGPIATTGNEGLRAHYGVFEWQQPRGLDEIAYVSFVLRPALAAQDPVLFIVP